jgi:hypothetical protein
MGSGTIAGISFGVILGIILVVGAFILLRRVRKVNRDTLNQSNDAWIKRESSKIVVGPDDAPLKNGVYHLSHKDPLGTVYMQEMASSEPRELEADTRTNELSPHQLGDPSTLSEHDSNISNGIAPYRDSIVTEPLPHVQAQRLRELEWLELEEAKLQQRREKLIQQGREQSSRPDGPQ